MRVSRCLLEFLLIPLVLSGLLPSETLSEWPKEQNGMTTENNGQRTRLEVGSLVSGTCWWRGRNERPVLCGKRVVTDNGLGNSVALRSTLLLVV